MGQLLGAQSASRSDPWARRIPQRKIRDEPEPARCIPSALPPNRIHAIVNGTRGISSAATDVRLSRFFGFVGRILAGGPERVRILWKRNAKSVRTIRNIEPYSQTARPAA